MKTYRLYFINASHGHVCDAIIEAKDMQEAIEYLYEDVKNDGGEIESLYRVEEIEYVLNTNAW